MVKVAIRCGSMRRLLMLMASCLPAIVTAAGEDPIASSQVATMPQVINYGVRSQKRIAITFDACSSINESKLDTKLVQILIDHAVPATLFMGGKWVQDQPAAARYLASIPLFEIANHAFHHPHLTRMSETAIQEELEHAQDSIESVTGVRPRYFRPPYGEYNSKLVNVAARLGLTTIQYDLASGDPDKRITAEQLSHYVIHNVKGGSIVVMHINQRGWRTAEALPSIIQTLRKRGYTFVTVSDLLNAPFAAPPLLLARNDGVTDDTGENSIHLHEWQLP